MTRVGTKLRTTIEQIRAVRTEQLKGLVLHSSFGQQATVFDSKHSGKLHPFSTKKVASIQPRMHISDISLQEPGYKANIKTLCDMLETYDMVKCKEPTEVF